MAKVKTSVKRPVEVAAPVALSNETTTQSGLIPLLGNLLFGLALLGAPLIGGLPSGAAYNGDVALNGLRALVCIAASVSFLLRPFPSKNLSVIALWIGSGWMVVSLLAHSRFFTNDVLLFAQLPATLDGICFALVFTVAVQMARETDRRVALLPLIAVVAGATICAATGLYQYLGESHAGRPDARIAATFFSPNFAAGLYALTLPIVAAFVLNQKSDLRRSVVAIVAGAVLVGGLACTGSRVGAIAAVVGLGIAVVLILVRSGRQFPWNRALIFGAAMAAMLIVFGKPILQRVGSSSSNSPSVSSSPSGNEQSVDFRKYTWRGTLRMALAHPIVGTGPGTFAYRYAPYAYVARTDLAHQSYLQLAAEAGIPALLAVGFALLWAFYGAHRCISDTSTDSPITMIGCGLVGGLVAGIVRGFSDSEWSLLGNTLPFWAIAGMLAALSKDSRMENGVAAKVSALPLHYLPAVSVVIPLIFSIVLLQSVNLRDTAIALSRSRDPNGASAAHAAANAFPPDPDALRLVDDWEGAARVEPSGKRFFQLARFYERNGENDKAITAFANSSIADPTNLQTLRAFAQATAKKSPTEALPIYTKMIAVQESPVGQVRAISERPEIYAVDAYAAVADAQSDSQSADALKNYEKGCGLTAQYANTPPLYLRNEEQMAQESGVDLAGRRRELFTLYNRMVDSGSAVARKIGQPGRADALQKQAAIVRSLLQKMIKDVGSVPEVVPH